jgi:acetylglutamate synthase
VIFYNKTTRKYESMPRGRMYVGGRTCRGSASEDSMLAVFRVLIQSSYKRKLIQDFLRQQNVK